MTSDSLPQCHNFFIVIDRSEFQRQSQRYLKNRGSTKSYDNFIDHKNYLDLLDDLEESRQNSTVDASNDTTIRRRRNEKPSPVAKKTKEKGRPTRAPANRTSRLSNRGKVALPTMASRRHNSVNNTLVDTKLLVSVKEMAHRKRLKVVPGDPMDLCQPLSIVLNDLNLDDGDKPVALDEDQLQRLIYQIANQSGETISF